MGKRWAAWAIWFALLVCVPTRAAESPVRVTVVAAGDITIGGDLRKSALASEAYYQELYERYDGDFLGGLSPVFSAEGVVTLVNLEGTLTTSTDHADKAWVFRAPPTYADVLARAGIDVIGHANNHALDFGLIGRRETRSTVVEAGMQYCADRSTAIVEVDGIVLGFCAFNAIDRRDPPNMETIIRDLREACDIVVVSFHWGDEFSHEATPRQRRLGRMVIRAGADLVVGHHAHVVQGIERYQGKYIVYGLGTLSSAIRTPDDMDTFIFQQTFAVDPSTRVVEHADVRLIPCSMSSQDAVNDARPVILSGTARERVLRKIEASSQPFAETVPARCFE